MNYPCRWGNLKDQMRSGLHFDEAIIVDDGVNERPDFAERLVRPLALRYGLVLAAVVPLLLADQAVIQPLLLRLNGDAPIIHLASRAVFSIVLLASLYAFVVRPATALIRLQLRMLAASESRHRALAQLLSLARDDLEQRVSERTKELSHANAALQRETARRREVEMRMRRLSSEVAHASRITALGQLAIGLAHEINQPLGAIANYTGVCELLLEGDPTDRRRLREAVKEVKRAALRAGEIVRRMRNFVRRSPDQSSLVDLNQMVREVVDLCEPELRRCDVELTLSLRSNTIPVVADPIQVQQVLVNLVQNAIQAMGDRSGRKVLGIRASRTPSGAQIDVTDSGPGFPNDSDAFAPFFSTKADGLGMGLAISQTIVEQHEGRIWAGNCPAGGAMVSFCLPLALAHETTQRDAAYRLCG